MKPLIVAASFLIVCSSVLHAHGAYNIFYVCIGSSDYITNETDADTASITVFRNVMGGNKSARLVSSLLDSKGARGRLYTSGDDVFIDRGIFFTSVDSVMKDIKNAKVRNPFIVYYYCGHGISEVVSGIRFMIPGNFNGRISDMHNEEKCLKMVSVNAIYDTLTLTGIPFLMMTDCCADKEVEYYEGMSAVLTGTAMDDISAVIDVMKAWFDLKGNNPLICSAQLGESARTVQDPQDSSSRVNIGPLCRRFLMAAAAYPEHISIQHLMETMQRDSFDNLTPVPVVKCADELRRFGLELY